MAVSGIWPSVLGLRDVQGGREDRERSGIYEGTRRPGLWEATLQSPLFTLTSAPGSRLSQPQFAERCLRHREASFTRDHTARSLQGLAKGLVSVPMLRL